MSKDTLLVNYACANAFKRRFYGKVLMREHVRGGMVRFASGAITYPDGQKAEEDLWGYVIEKANIKYFLEAKDAHGNLIDYRKVMPIFAEELTPFSYRDLVHNHIGKPVPAVLKPNRRMSFRQFVDKLSCLPHTNTKHARMMWFVVLTQMMDRANFRVCSPPSFGKDSVVGIVGNIFGNAATITQPTVAKLEYRTTYKLIVVNEAVNITKASWEVIEPFALEVGDFKPEIEKRSRSLEERETLSVADFSFAFFYNDVDTFPRVGDADFEYFEDKTPDAVINRYMPMRFYGTYTHDFNEVQTINVENFIDENFDTYRSLVSTFTHFKEQLFDTPIRWTMNIPENVPTTHQKFPERWRINAEKLLRVVQLYSESEEEYRTWEKVLWDSVEDYHVMLQFQREFTRMKEQMSSKDFQELRGSLKKFDTFKQKLAKIKRSNDTPDYAGLTQWQTS